VSSNFGSSILCIFNAFLILIHEKGLLNAFPPLQKCYFYTMQERFYPQQVCAHVRAQPILSLYMIQLGSPVTHLKKKIDKTRKKYGRAAKNRQNRD